MDTIMVIVNYALLIVLAVGFVVLALGFLLLITRNVKQGRIVRQQLARHVETLRMSKMLKALGIDYSKYLHTVPLSKINDSMGKCETCDTTDLCDSKLEQGNLTPDEIDFCPNQDCLRQFSEMQEQDSEKLSTERS